MTRTFHRTMRDIRATNANQINQLNVQLSGERLNAVQTTISDIIQQIEYTEAMETVTRQHEVQQITDRNEIFSNSQIFLKEK